MVNHSSSGSSSNFEKKVESNTRTLLSFIYKNPYFVLIFAILLTLGAGYLGTNLKLRTKIQDLLPDHAPSVVASRSLSERLGSVDQLVLTLMSDDFDQVRATLPELQKQLENLEAVRAVQWQQDIELIQKNALITFPSLVDLKQAYDDLSEEIRKTVQKKMRLLDEDESSNDDELKNKHKKKLDHTAKSIFISELQEQLHKQEGQSFSWGELEDKAKLSEIGGMFRDLNSDYPQYFYNSAYTTIGLKVFPAQSSNDIQFCEKVVREVNEVAQRVIKDKLGPISASGVVRRLDLGGTYVNVLNQSKKIKGDMLSSTLTSFALLSLVLILAFRSIRGKSSS